MTLFLPSFPGLCIPLTKLWINKKSSLGRITHHLDLWLTFLPLTLWVLAVGPAFVAETQCSSQLHLRIHIYGLRIGHKCWIHSFPDRKGRVRTGLATVLESEPHCMISVCKGLFLPRGSTRQHPWRCQQEEERTRLPLACYLAHQTTCELFCLLQKKWI